MRCGGIFFQLEAHFYYYFIGSSYVKRQNSTVYCAGNILWNSIGSYALMQTFQVISALMFTHGQ